jgi:hypothetical protein
LAELFTSFDDAWSAFIAREAPLESFFDEFPEDVGHEIDWWLIEPSQEIRSAAHHIQERLAPLEWLVPIPDHFLHVSIGAREDIGSAWRAWRDIDELAVSYERVNCFHTAVVVELDPAARLLVRGTTNDSPTFLPHLTIAVVREPSSPEPLREALVPMREARLGSQGVQEAKLVRVPASRTTVLRPWTVLRKLALGRGDRQRSSGEST